MRNIRLRLEFEGTNYAGWQKQKNALTVQECIENKLLELTGEQTEVFGCSRTDAGVHAKEYFCNFHTDSKIPDTKFREALNSKLPPDIVVLDSEEAAADFHARYNSSGKMYSYTILNRANPCALNRNFVYHYKRDLDVALMKKGAEALIGKNDFAAFRNAGSSVKTTVRTMKSINIIKEDCYVKIYLEADGFLYNMARIIVGTLMDVGTKKTSPDCVKKILDSGDRKMAGRSVPAKGLCLEKVFY